MLAGAPQQRGLGLLELLLSTALGLLMMSALTVLFAHTLGVNSRSLQLSLLQSEATAVFDLMVSDIGRSGYRANAHLQVLDANNTSTAFDNSLVISNHPDEALHSCIMFRYDANKNGVFDGSRESFGYRLRNRQVQRRQGGADCASSGWQSLTSTDMAAVEHLRFELHQRTGATAGQLLQLALTLVHAKDTRLQRQLISAVMIRNGG